ncbi:MAG: C1 family peptidase [Syntrophobacteraceae bacterium]
MSFYADFLLNNPTDSNGDYVTYDSAGDSADHEVAIIGWNDNFPARNFAEAGFDPPPPGDGAWLVRNSWGAWWGNNGCFWLSYYDTSLNIDAYAYDGVGLTPRHGWIYQYDNLG